MPIVDKIEWEWLSEIKQNRGELARCDGVFAIDKGMTYKFERLFITTMKSSCVSFKLKDQRVGCRSLTVLSDGDAAIVTPIVLLIKVAQEACTLKQEGWLKETCPTSSLQENIEGETCLSKCACRSN